MIYMDKYISIAQWAKKRNVKAQSVYRWIREKKFTDETIKKEEVMKKYLKIKENALVPKGCGEIKK